MIEFSNKYYYDKKAAESVITFIEKFIRHVKGELATHTIKLEEWQKEDIIRPVFGIKRKSDGLRRFRTVYLEIPRKNAKSTLGAALALYMLVGDGEPGAEVFSAAGDRDQAAIIFGIARGMVEQEPELIKRCKPFQHSITHQGRDKITRFYKVLSAEAKTKHGFNAHAIIFDELHTQPNRELWDVLTTSTGSRRQPLTFAITTAGYDKESICYEIHEYAQKVKSGVIQDDSFLPVVYSAPMESDIYLPETWKAANPGYGSIVKEEYIQEQVLKIKNQPSFESTFRRLHLNQWVGTAETWISDDDWMKNSDEPICEGPCYAGLDLAQNRDICALVLYWPESHSVVPFFWVPSEVVIPRSRSEGVNYDVWADNELIYTTPGNAVDYDYINIKAKELIEKYNIITVGFDRYGIAKVAKFFNDHGLENKLDEFGQGYISMSTPCKELESLAADGKLRHGGNPVLRWMASNVQIDQDAAANIKINKGKSREKVDGIVALAMAIGTSMTSEPEKRSRYEDNPELDVIQL